MPADDWKRRLHEAVDQLNAREGEQLAGSWDRFRDWANGILRSIGVVLETIGNALWSFWKGFVDIFT
ncbi:MAG: hypothetical protein IJD43_06015 [Thermoguttaceae bacterium]|nr:hypothetical protein [Thermoguttaceae bacterium]